MTLHCVDLLLLSWLSINVNIKKPNANLIYVECLKIIVKLSEYTNGGRKLCLIFASINDVNFHFCYKILLFTLADN